jgi:hypothetical protein
VNLPSLNSEELADLLEALVLCSESRALGFKELETVACRALEVTQTRVDFALTIVERRQRLLADSYPFRLSASALARKPDVMETWYASLLAMAPNTVFRSVMTQEALLLCSTVFERIAERALAAMLGPGSETVRFGWPSECGRPPEFPDAIAWLADKMGLRVGGGYRPPRRRDGGVDIIAWKGFADGRTAFPIMLGQCTVQRDFLSKALDIDLRNWGQWLLTLRDPTTALLVPAVLSGTNEDWNEAAQRHIILDRIRIAQLLHGGSLCPQDIAGLSPLTHDLVSRAGDAIQTQ